MSHPETLHGDTVGPLGGMGWSPSPVCLMNCVTLIMLSSSSGLMGIIMRPGGGCSGVRSWTWRIIPVLIHCDGCRSSGGTSMLDMSVLCLIVLLGINVLLC